MTLATVHLGDCLDVLAGLPDASIDAVVTDPPYGLAPLKAAQVADTVAAWAAGDTVAIPTGRGFMGAEWDRFVPPPAVWVECLRVLKPGGHLLAFAGARTQDLMGLSVRLAGFELRDSLAWVYGSGFPKSMDVSKAIDKVNGEGDRLHKFTAYMRTTGLTARQLNEATGTRMGGHYLTAASQPAIPTPTLWAKIRPMCGDVPAWVDELVDRIEAEREVLVARQAKDRRSDGTVIGLGHAGSADITAPATPEAERWDGWGTALKPALEPVIVARKPLEGTVAANVLAHGTGALNIDACRVPTNEVRVQGAQKATGATNFGGTREGGKVYNKGRWPANVLLDEHAAAEMDQQSGITTSRAGKRNAPKAAGTYGAYAGDDPDRMGHADTGGASRYFPAFRYQAKAPTRERPEVDGIRHPTVKPVELMRWLIRLVTPPGGTVLDPFAGSGTTLEAAHAEGFDAVGIEAHEPYTRLITARLDRAGADYRIAPQIAQEAAA